jgi:pyrroloquinoline quinone biosynthesis protein D
MSAIADQARPRLPRGVRLRHDKTRDAWMLLGPERLVLPDETALEVLRRCDGERTVAAIVTELARSYEAEPAEIRADVAGFLEELLDQRMIEL